MERERTASPWYTRTNKEQGMSGSNILFLCLMFYGYNKLQLLLIPASVTGKWNLALWIFC